MGSRLFREQEIAGSTPAAPTRSFVQWQGRGPTNRRRGFDSLSSDHSPIDGREPAFEAGDVGSTPARGANDSYGGRGVLACTPRCERGGNGFNPLRSPSNWVWVNGWPP